MTRRRFSFSISNLLPKPVNKTEKGQRKSLVTSLFPSFNTKSRRTSIRGSITAQDNYESVIFVWFDPEQLPTTNTINQLRSINDSVRVYTNSFLCFETIRWSNEKIFFILSSSDHELIATINDLPNVEAIFLLDPHIKTLRSNFPKLCGIFNQEDKLFRELRETLDVYEQVQLEAFVYEEDNIFLWRQLWKEDVSNRVSSFIKIIFLNNLANQSKNIIE